MDNLDDWYRNRHLLESMQVFRLHDGSIVRLVRRVPGDGIDWIVDDWVGDHWSCEETQIHPGDIAVKLPEAPTPPSQASQQRMLAPDIGALFTYRGSHFRVSGWICP
ncbi:hypothetical protein R5M92_04245 [Halomonas sp. Bachu 37]|uniref:hypothetical protein n=1 Tax=Halomonas kashgarensis TaxID=3084920 RepID=UPI003216D6A5